MADVHKPTDAPPPTKEGAAPDNLDSARMANPKDVQTQTAQANTADDHLPNTSIDTPYNPKNVAGTYDKKDIDFAKSKGFNADEVHTMEADGPQRFHDAMTYLQSHPDKVADTKQFVDGVIQYHYKDKDAIFNPMNIPGQYDRNDINFMKQNGFTPDQMHVMEQYGPQNLHGIVQYMQANPYHRPDVVGDMKQTADAVGYWQTHPDLPAEAGKTNNAINPDAVKTGTELGFSKQQMQFLGQWGADNFNGIFGYLKQHPDQADNFKGLIAAVGTWEVNASKAGAKQSPPGVTVRR